MEGLQRKNRGFPYNNWSGPIHDQLLGALGNIPNSVKLKGYIMSNTELNKVIRDMQNASLASAKQSPLFNQQAANVVQQGVADKKANPVQPTIKLFTK